MELVFSNVNKYISYFPFIEREYIRCLEIGEAKANDSVTGTGSFLALYNIGTVYETNGNTVKAIECYKKSLEYQYKSAQTRIEVLTK